MQVTDLVRYNHVVRDLYFDPITKLPWSEVTADMGLSFNSMRNAFLHLTIVEDKWISYVIPGHFKDWVDPEFTSFADMDSLKKYMQHVKANTEANLEELSAEKLSQQIVIPWDDKPNTKITIETRLTHMVMEDMIHYGELSAAFWQMALEAP